jgi:nucleoside-diphosphate-sugar epimerase
MRVLVAGATGVVGRQVVPLLEAVGHDVTGLARNRREGLRIVTADALDRDAVARAVKEARPDVIVNLLTAIPAEINPRRIDRDFELTNRLRIEGTRNLVAAAGGARLISEGLAYFYQPGPGLADEEAPQWTTNTPKQFVPLLGALQALEATTTDAGGLVLRFGHLYGPGTAFAPDSSYFKQIQAGKLPLVGDAGSVFSFIHTSDAASAIVAALDKDISGALNIVDDKPTPMNEWLPELARMLDAPAPKRVPVVLARLAAGAWGTAFMTRLRGADNARARLQLDWRPRHPSWSAGFAELANG